MGPEFIMKRSPGGLYPKSYQEIYPPLDHGSLLDGSAAKKVPEFQLAWDTASERLTRKSEVWDLRGVSVGGSSH